MSKRHLDQMDQDGSEGGNSYPPSDQSVKKSKHRPPLGQRWIFVDNNYSKIRLDQWIKILDESDWPSGFSEEVGASGTHHLQGYINFTKRVRPAEMKVFKELTDTKHFHWGDEHGKPCRGTDADNVKYFSKDDNEKVYLFNGLRKPRVIKFPEFNKPWQKEIMEAITVEPDDRSILWYWSRAGGIGKSTFCKYLVLKHDACILAGKGADVRNAVLTYKQDRGDFPYLCVYNIPRTFDSEYLRPECLENVKDMLFYSGKYEGGSVAGPCPHLIIFSNFNPKNMDWDSEFLARIVTKNIDEADLDLPGPI